MEQKQEKVPVHEAVARHLNHQERQHIYKGAHMRGDVWPSKRMDPPKDPHRPLTKREKRGMRLEARKAGRPDPITQPRRTRHLAPIAHPTAVQRWLEQDAAKQCADAGQLTALMGRGYGYRTTAVTEDATKRVQRFIDSMARDGVRRIPAHIRDRAVLASAVVQAIVARFPEESTPDMVQGVEQVHMQFGGAR